MADSSMGQRLGNYRLIRLLGHGGFADVYLGEHIYLKTQAAIKVLHTQLQPEDIEKFRSEALTIAHLIHPHIIRVLDFDVENAAPFLVMDCAPNDTLRHRHPRGTRLPSAVFLPYVKQVASALQYAHDQKLIHRDVKPENMLLGRNNEVLLSDFGIALVSQNSLSQSTEDLVIGTMSYMAPEQIQGKPRPASDQYALGVVVYEWISGMKPFNGSYMEIVTQHLSAPPPPLDERALELPHAVQQVVLRALAKDPHQRYERVQDFANALEQAYQSKGPAVGMPPPVAVTPPQANRTKQPVFTVYPPVDTVPPQQVNQAKRLTNTVEAYNFPIAPSAIPKSAQKLGHGLRRGLKVLAILVVLCGLLVCGLGYAAFHYFSAQNTPVSTAGASAMAGDFMQAVSNRNYDQAYNDLGPPVTRDTTRDQFKNQAQSEDSCYGTVTHYTVINAGTPSKGNTLSYRYTITREKLSRPYQLDLTLQQGSSGNWQVTDYNSNVGQTPCG